MNFSIEATTLNCPDWRGVQFYSYYLLDALTDLAPQDRFLLHFNGMEVYPHPNALTRKPNVAYLNRPGRMAYHGWLPLDLLRFRSRAYYSLNSRLKTPLPRPAAMMLYDAGWFTHPEFYGPGEAAWQAEKVRQSARYATLLFTLTEAMKAELADVLRFDPQRIIVAPCAGMRHSDEEQKPAGFPDAPYFLMVNPGRPNKNWVNTLHGFHLYRLQNPASPVKLVLTGTLRGEREKIQQLACELALEDHLVLTGYVDDAALTYLYRHARLLIFPSWYEGFGIPVLEAMAHDLPVIVSDIPVFRETAADAALYVPPDKPEAFAEAFARLAEDESLRRSLIAGGRARLNAYSWRRSAQITLDALRAPA